MKDRKEGFSVFVGMCLVACAASLSHAAEPRVPNPVAMVAESLSSNDIRSAEVLLADIRKADPDSPDVRWAEAEIRRRRHDTARSEKLLAALLQDQPGHLRAQLTLAIIRFDQARFADALKLALSLVDRAADVDDRLIRARALALAAGAKGMLAFHGGMLDKLRHGPSSGRLLTRAEQLAPGFPDILYARGAWALLAPAAVGGSVDTALENLRKAVEKDPWHADAWARLAQAHLAKGDRQKYEECLGKALQIDSANVLAADIRDGTGRFGIVRPPTSE